VSFNSYGSNTGRKTFRPGDADAAWALCGGLRRKGQLLEKLEEAPWLTLAHGRAERGAHPNLIEINAFVVRAAFEYGSTSIMETL
jgi:hypothetical protein